EAARDVFVPVAEEVDGEVSAVAQRRITLRLVVHADQDLRRIERDRAERAHGEPGRTAVGVTRGDERAPRGEVTENATKLFGGDHSTYVSGRVGKNQARAGAGRPALAGGRASNILLGSTLDETAAPSGSNRRSTPGAVSFQRLARAPPDGEHMNTPQIGKRRSHSGRPARRVYHSSVWRASRMSSTRCAASRIPRARKTSSRWGSAATSPSTAARSASRWRSRPSRRRRRS